MGAAGQRPDDEGWVILTDEPNQLAAEVVLHYLRGEGVPARLDAGDTMSFLGTSPNATRVLVPAEWEEEAWLALERRGQDEPPPGVRF